MLPTRLVASSSSFAPFVDWYSSVSISIPLPAVRKRPENLRRLKASVIAFMVGFSAGASCTEVTTVCRKSKSSACCSKPSLTSLYLSALILSNICRSGAFVSAFRNCAAVPRVSSLIFCKMERSPSFSIFRMLCAPTWATSSGAPMNIPRARRRSLWFFALLLRSTPFRK